MRSVVLTVLPVSGSANAVSIFGVYMYLLRSHFLLHNVLVVVNPTPLHVWAGLSATDEEEGKGGTC